LALIYVNADERILTGVILQRLYQSVQPERAMQKFSWRTMIIFVLVLLLGLVLIGLSTAYVSKLKQQRRQLSDSCPFRTTLGGGACAPIRPTYRSSTLQSNQSSGGGNLRPHQSA